MKKILVVVLAVVLACCLVAAAGCGSTGKTASNTTTPVKVPARAPTKTVKVGDITMGYRVYGKGYPLLMIMGYGGSQDIWDPNVIASLAKHYKVITFDNRGMGATTAGTQPFTIQQFANDTAGLMNALGIPKAHVLGWSMGTYVAQDLVLTDPQKVNRLVLYAADCGGPQSTGPSADVMKQLTDTSGTPQQRGERLMSLLIPQGWVAVKKNAQYLEQVLSSATEPTPAESVQKQVQAMGEWFQNGTYAQLPTIKSQTMMLTGTEDILTPPQNSLIMVNQIPQSWLTQFRGGGHGVQFQYPQAFANAVLDFLAAP